MSGHSKWSTIKRAKELKDSKRSKEITKSLKQIVSSVREGGTNPESNFLLKNAINKAKNLNISNTSINNAIKKGSGEDKRYSDFETIFYEAYGPFGSIFLIECFTNNKNRVISDIRNVLEKNGGKLVDNGTINWQFELQFLITLKFLDDNIKNVDKFNKISDLNRIESYLFDIDGIIDYHIYEDAIYIYIDPNKITQVKDFFYSNGVLIDEIEKKFVSKIPISPSEEELVEIDNFIDILSGIDDIESVYSNI